MSLPLFLLLFLLVFLQLTFSSTESSVSSIPRVGKEGPFPYDFILSEETARELLAIDQVESFQIFPLTFMAHKRWPYMTLINKFPYIVDKYFLMTMKKEFQAILKLSPSPSETCSSTDSCSSSKVSSSSSTVESVVAFTRDQLYRRWLDFQTIETLNEFFKFCDVDKNESVDWMEYLVCRGWFDQQGTSNDQCEFDFLENVAVDHFRYRLNDPQDPMALDLMERGLI